MTYMYMYITFCKSVSIMENWSCIINPPLEFFKLFKTSAVSINTKLECQFKIKKYKYMYLTVSPNFRLFFY